MKIFNFESRLGSDYYSALNEIAKLADVARIGLSGKPRHRPGGNHRALNLLALAVEVGEMIDEQRNIVAALAQRRQPQGYQINAVVEVLAECAIGYHLFEPRIGGTNNAHIGVARPAVAERFERALLKHTQQLHLRRLVQIANLVEENRAALGSLKAPFAGSNGAGERPFRVAEHLALEKRARNAAEIDRHEALVAPAAVGMDGAGYQFLAGAVLAENQHRGIGRSHSPHLLQHGLERRRLPDDTRTVEAVGIVAVDHGRQADGCSHAFEERGVVPWLGDEIKRPGLHSLDGKRDAAPRRD